MTASLHWRFLDRFVIGEWTGVGYDFFQIPRGYGNLLIGNSIFCTETGGYGPYASMYLNHPLVAVAVGPWTAPLAPWTAFWTFVGVSLGLLLLSAWLLASAFGSPACRGFVYFAIFCSLPTYFMLWNGQAHVLLVLAIALILSGLMRLAEEPQLERRYCRWIQLGLLISLLSKPTVVLMLPVLFLLPETRRKLLFPVAVYAAVSLLFLIVSGLNPGGYNGLHWLNIGSIASSPQQSLMSLGLVEKDLLKDSQLFSLPIFLGRILGGPAPAIFLKLPHVVLLLMSLSPLVLDEREQRLRATVVTVSLCILSHFLCYYPALEYHYTTLLPVLPALLWLWQRETVPRLRRLLMASFVVSLLVFVPTPRFLAPEQPDRFQTINLLQRVVPVLAAFFGLAVYGAASTWLGRRRPKLITAQMIRQLLPMLWRGAVLGLLLGSVLAAAYSTVPSRLLSPLSTWTGKDWGDQYDEFIAQLQRTVQSDPASARAHGKLGIVLTRRSRFKEALGQFQRALEIEPDDTDSRANLANSLAALGRFEEAFAQFRRLLAIEPDNAQILNALAEALAGSGRLDEAINQYRKAVQIKPDYAEAHNNLGYAFARQGRIDEAIAEYQKALEIEPDYVTALNNLGTVFTRLGRLDEAMAQFQKALEIRPDLAEVRDNLGYVFAREGRLDEAMAQYQKALEIEPDYVMALNHLGTAFARLSQFDEAIAQYRKAVKIQPDLAEAHNNLGYALANRGRLDEAITQYQKAVEIQPGLAEGRNNLGYALASRGRIDEAMAQYRKALQIKPDSAEIRCNLGDALAARSRFDEAVTQYRKAFELAAQHNRRALADVLRAKIARYEGGKTLHQPPQRLPPKP